MGKSTTALGVTGAAAAILRIVMPRPSDSPETRWGRGLRSAGVLPHNSMNYEIDGRGVNPVT
jgi:hypothetical protein